MSYWLNWIVDNFLDVSVSEQFVEVLIDSRGGTGPLVSSPFPAI